MFVELHYKSMPAMVECFFLLCDYSSHFLITLAIGAILMFMVLRNVVKIQMPNPTDMFVSNLCHCHYIIIVSVSVCLNF